MKESSVMLHCLFKNGNIIFAKGGRIVTNHRCTSIQDLFIVSSYRQLVDKLLRSLLENEATMLFS